MNRPLLKCVWLGVWVAVAAFQAVTAEILPPLPPLPPSPLQFFRDLLNTNEAGRTAFLAGKLPEQRQAIEAKLAEYLALPADQRELRLCLTELRWYLLAVLRAPEKIRLQYLGQVPEKYRSLVQDRLKIWDTLPEENRKEMLQNEAALAYIIRLEQTTPLQGQALLAALPEEKRRQVATFLEVWRGLPVAQQQAMVSRFQQFFGLTEPEKRQTLKSVPVEQRQQTEQVLGAFERLPKEQREKCLAAFQQFLNLTAKEREQFLQNAIRWQAMSPETRQSLSNWVQKFPPLPPLPPGFGTPPSPPITIVSTNQLRGE
jgi:hypothetical protein